MGKILLTGTRAYGPVSENSDIDIVMLKADALSLLLKLKNECIDYTQEDDYGDASSFKFSLAEELPPINIIVAEDETFFFKWEYATEKMKKLPPIPDREARIEAFHHFQDEGFNIAMQENGRKFLEEYKEKYKEEFTKNQVTLGGFPLHAMNVQFSGFVDDDVNPPLIDERETYVVHKCPAAQTIAEAIDARELARNLDRVDDAYNDDDV